MSEKKYESYMSTDTIPLPYCPGCGHTVVVKALNAALVKLQLDPKQVVIVTDIGCIGLADRNFTTSAFHGLHGRSITYACGLKLARPELTVIAIKGDGACGIGGTHLLNVARRNIGITLLVANNFNYGMTGGQHSVTTPTAGWTTTTPWGNVERPMDLCATTAAAGAAWVRRATTFDKDLPEQIALAIEQPGFAMLDIWELCAAYYGSHNESNKKELLELVDRLGFPLGQVADDPRPEYSVSYRQAFEQARVKRPAPPAIEVRYPNQVTRQTGIIIAGSAGQKVKSAAGLFSQFERHFHRRRLRDPTRLRDPRRIGDASRIGGAIRSHERSPAASRILVWHSSLVRRSSSSRGCSHRHETSVPGALKGAWRRHVRCACCG